MTSSSSYGVGCLPKRQFKQSARERRSRWCFCGSELPVLPLQRGRKVKNQFGAGDTRLGLPWRRTAEQETTRGGQNRNSSAALTVCAHPRPCLLRKSDVACKLKRCCVVLTPSAKAKNNIYGNAGGWCFNRPGSWVKTGLGNSTRRCQDLMSSGCHRNFVMKINHL